MKFQNLIKIITRNTAILSIVFAFLLGLVGMTGLRSKILNTSNWFMSEEEVAEKFGDDDKQDENSNDNQNGKQQPEGNPDGTDAQNHQDSNQSGNSSETGDLGNVVTNTDVSSDLQDTSNSDNSGLTDFSNGSDGSDISDVSGSEDPLTSDQLSQSGNDSDMTSSTKLSSETTKTTQATTTSSTTRPTETQAPADSTTTTEAPTTVAPTTQAPETTTTEAPTTTTVETTTEATTQKSSGSLGDTSGTFDNSMARQILDRVNEERAANGRSPLSWNDTLASDAAIRATELPVLWSHKRPDGSDWYTAGSGTSYGENLAKGQSSVDQAITDWMNSEGHRENILSPDFTRIGVACYYCNGKYYWVQEFG